MKMFARYITAIISSVLIFLFVWLLLGLVFLLILPRSWSEIELRLGLVSASIPCIASLIFACLAATHTFKASLNAKTGILYRSKTNNR